MTGPISKLDRIRHDLLLAEGKLARALDKNVGYEGILLADVTRLRRQLEAEDKSTLKAMERA